MPFLLLVLAGIVLVLNAGWFAGAALIGWLLIGGGLLFVLLFTVIFGGILTAILKGTKGPGTPRAPRRR